MKHKFFSALLVCTVFGCGTKVNDSEHNIITSDITRFWEAYDQIISTQDSILQYKYLDSLYFRKGTIGLEAIREARNYTPQDYIQTITGYPKFWASIRGNTLKVKEISGELEVGLEKLKAMYPDLKPAKIYFEIGALRTPGTAMDSLLLIGAELAMADSETVTTEFPERLSFLKSYFETNPKNNLVFLNVHEYVHTQQNPRVFNILSLVLYEGVAEFVSAKALGVPSPNPQIAFGTANADRLREVFERELFYTNNLYKWLDGNSPNEFGMRDLGYAVGYQICEKYYHQADDKAEAIKTMIELDYENEGAVEDFVKKANYFSASLDTLYERYENSRPTVVGIKQFENHSKTVSTKVKELTVEFSQPLNGHHTGVDFGDLGQDAFPKGSINGRTWGEDNSSWTLPVELEPNKRYQVLISTNFRTKEGIPLKEFLIEFTTGAE